MSGLAESAGVAAEAPPLDAPPLDAPPLDAPPLEAPPDAEEGSFPPPGRFYKRVQVGAVRVRDYGAASGPASPAGRLLAKTLSRRYAEAVRGKRVVEVGAVSGVAGMTAAKLGAASVALLAADIAHSRMQHIESAMNGVYATTKTVCCDWTAEIPTEVAAEPADVVVAADVLTTRHLAGEFAAALDALAAPGARVLVGAVVLGTPPDERALEVVLARGWSRTDVLAHADDAEPAPPGLSVVLYELVRDPGAAASPGPPS